MNAYRGDVAALVQGLEKTMVAEGADFVLLENLVQTMTVRYAWVAGLVLWVSLEMMLIQLWNDMWDAALLENQERQSILLRVVERNHLGLWGNWDLIQELTKMLLISAGREVFVFFESLVMLKGNDMMGVVALVIQEW